MIVYFDTVRRKRPVREGGELVRMDWSSKRVLGTVPLFPTDPDIHEDPNPRGNSRGGKGILLNANCVFVGTYHTILVFDHQLHPVGRITHPLFVNIHEMCWDDGDLWVAATTIDAAIRVNLRGETRATWWPREESRLQQRYALEPMAIDKACDNRLRYLADELSTKPHHTHLNCVAQHGGRTYALLNRQGALVRLAPDVAIVVEDERLRGGHSAKITPDGQYVVACCSFRRSLVVFELNTGRFVREVELLRFAEIETLHLRHPDQPFNRSIFVRGLEMLDSGRVLTGISPATILEVDLDREDLIDFWSYSDEVGDAIHGLAAYPDSMTESRP